MKPSSSPLFFDCYFFNTSLKNACKESMSLRTQKLRRILLKILWREISKSYELICNKFNNIECKNQKNVRIFSFNFVYFLLIFGIKKFFIQIYFWKKNNSKGQNFKIFIKIFGFKLSSDPYC